MSADLLLVILLLVVVVVPRVFQRYGLPSAITALLPGFSAQLAGFDLPSSALNLLSTRGDRSVNDRSAPARFPA